jgi:hypothetical protein
MQKVRILASGSESCMLSATYHQLGAELWPAFVGNIGRYVVRKRDLCTANYCKQFAAFRKSLSNVLGISEYFGV